MALKFEIQRRGKDWEPIGFVEVFNLINAEYPFVTPKLTELVGFDEVVLHEVIIRRAE